MSNPSNLDAGLVATLTASAGINGLVAGRITFFHVEGNVFPALVLQLVSDVDPAENISTGPSGLLKTVYQVKCWDKTLAGAKALAKMVKRLLAGFAGVMTGADGSVTPVQYIRYMGSAQEHESAPGVAQLRAFAIRQ